MVPARPDNRASHAARLSGRSRTSGTSSRAVPGPPQPRQCSIVVVLTTTMFQRRGQQPVPRNRNAIRHTTGTTRTAP